MSDFLGLIFQALGEYKEFVAIVVLAILGFLYINKKLLYLMNCVHSDDDVKFEKLHHENEKRKTIEAKLETLLGKVNANRAYIYLFHNGTRYYTGNHQIRVSAVVEVVENANPMIQTKQNLMIGLFPKIIDTLLNDGYAYMDMEKMPKYRPEKIFADLHSTKTWVAAPIEDGGKFIGVLALDYTRRKPIAEDKIKDELMKLSYELAPYYDNSGNGNSI